MKIFLRSTDTTDKENPVTIDKPIESLNEALIQQKTGERIHFCYHDEKNPKPCKLI